jgi:hypothetical protein
VKIEISKSLHDRLAHKITNSTFSDVSELVEFVMSEFLKVEEERRMPPLSEKENIELQNRLKKLGYE